MQVGNLTYFFTTSTATGTASLWKTNGTPAGTALVKDIQPGRRLAPSALTNVGGTLFFTTYDGANGYDLWKSDGTTAGTVVVKDVQSGSGYSNLSASDGRWRGALLHGQRRHQRH